MMETVGIVVLWIVAIALVGFALLGWAAKETARSKGISLGSGHRIAGIAALVLIVLLLSGCARGGPIVSATSGCAQLLPQDWKQGVAGADLPSGDTVGDWISFGDAQTGKLDMANGRTVDAIGIVERCEARDAEAIRRAGRGFFGRLLNL